MRYPTLSIESLFICNKERQSLITSSHSNEHEPVILNGNTLLVSVNLNSFCAKEMTFKPNPLYVDWLQLQKDFDAFPNILRSRFIIKSSQSNNNNNNNNTNNSNNRNNKNNIMPISHSPHKKSKWRAPKTASPELETFLSNLERRLFSDTSRKAIYENLSTGEMESLTN